MAAKVEVVSTAPAGLGEGPHWDEKRQMLYYVDLLVGDIHRFDPKTKMEDKVHADKRATFVIPRRDNGDEFVFGSERSIKILDWNTREVKTIASVDQDKPENSTILNDGKCDAAGRLWTGSVSNGSDFNNIKPNLGSLYSIDGKHEAVKRYSPVTISNGIDWSNDNEHLYYVDTSAAVVHVFDFDLASGEIGNRKTAVDFKTLGSQFGKPDGITVDRDNKLWIACFMGSCVIQVDPETGKILQTIKFPVTQISSCCFGGEKLTDLYVTSIECLLSDEERKVQPLAGRVFKVTGLNGAGNSSNEFAG